MQTTRPLMAHIAGAAVRGRVVIPEKGMSSSWQGLLATNVDDLLRKNKMMLWYFGRLANFLTGKCLSGLLLPGISVYIKAPHFQSTPPPHLKTRMARLKDGRAEQKGRSVR